MPRDMSIKKVLVIGSGPIVIGQAAEFDYSGTQACRAFKEEGVEVVLVNSNPATIMTDAGLADYTYIEPLTVDFIEKIIEKERPDSIIAGMGGQTALNMSCELYDSGVLDKYGVRVIGSSIAAIKEGEDRKKFKNLMKRINQPVIESEIVNDIESGIAVAERIGYPVIIRPAYTLGGTGGGTACNEDELTEILSLGLNLSRVHQALIEKSIKGWKEIEFEVIRDSYGNCVIVCSMENVDPVGVHTGDSIVVAPAQTLSMREYNMLKDAALIICNEIKIVGGCNVQFALEPHSFDYTIIEINPRVSRSSALASKATGYPIAKVACKIALGYALDEIKNVVTGSTYACFEPTVDYIVLKIPKWPFDKFAAAKRKLGTKMMATGEVMAIGSNFEQAFLKGVRSLEIGQYSLERASSGLKTLEELRASVIIPDDERIFDVAEMLRRNYMIEKVCEITGMDAFFINKIKNIVDLEEGLKELQLIDLNPELLRFYKTKGFADKAIAGFMNCAQQDIYRLRKEWGITPVYKMVDTCSGEFAAVTPYYYSTYDYRDEAVISHKKKALVIGSGPIRIGQGIEFDYCSVHSVLALKKIGAEYEDTGFTESSFRNNDYKSSGIETIIINNNPETVSTDFDTSDKLYFEPLTEEDVLAVVEKEKPDGVILQFGGQTAIKLADFFKELSIPIYGTKPEQIDAAEDREKFDAILNELSIARPQGRSVRTLDEGLAAAKELGFPLLVRPSYVLGGQGMQITYDLSGLTEYLTNAFLNDARHPVLVDRYLSGREIEVDAICDGESVFIPGIMEHLERAGVHSGDSISIYPPQNISEKIRGEIIEVTKKISIGLKVIGMINIQYIEYENELYIIEVNPRSSRTVPFISKVTGVPVIELATRVMLGEKLTALGYDKPIAAEPPLVAVKVPVFSTEKLSGVEVTLGPEMRSTGEVMGIGKTYIEAMYKGFLAAKLSIPKKGDVVLASVRKQDQADFAALAKRFAALGCVLRATEGTAAQLEANGINVETVNKINFDSPNILDITHSGLIKLAIHIPSATNDIKSDAFAIRRATAESGVSLLTSLDTVRALLEVCESGINDEQPEIIRMVATKQ